MKEYDINGKLIVDGDLTHIEMLEVLYEHLTKAGIHFKGETRLKHAVPEIHNNNDNT